MLRGASTVALSGNVTHFWLAPGSYGAIYGANINMANGVPPGVVVAAGAIAWKIIAPYLQSGTGSGSWISCDSSSASKVIVSTPGYSNFGGDPVAQAQAQGINVVGI